MGALVNTVHGEIAGKIKVSLSEDYITHKITHALAGCGAGVANKGKCLDGAIGAAVGEMVGEALVGDRRVQDLSPKERERILGYARIVAGSVAALSKGDVNTAANAAQTAVLNNALSFDSTPTNPQKHPKKSPDKTVLEKIIQGIEPLHAAGALSNPQDKDATALVGNIRNNVTGKIVITTYGIYAAGLNAPLVGSAAKSALTACMANPSGCTVMVTQAAEAGAGLATGAVTVGNAWETSVGALSRAKAAKQAVSTQTVNQLANLAKAEQQVLTRIAQRDAQLSAWKTGFNGRVKKGAGLLDASKITIQIGNKTVKPIESMSLKGTPVYSRVSEQEIFALYRQITGENPNFRKLPKGSLANGYISTGEWAGFKVVLRNFSTTKNSTQARWTLDLQNTPASVRGDKLELKFQ